MAQEEPIKTLKLTRASEVEAQAVTWLMDDLIPLKTLTVVSGNSGIGKTTVVLLFLANLTNGTLPGEFHTSPRDVIIMSPEDDPGAITRPRLEAAGANLDRVHFLSATRPGTSGEIDTTVSFPSDMNMLHEAIREVKPGAIMLDPIASLIDGNLDKREDVRVAFDALAGEIANRYNLAVILIAHNKKGMDSVRGKISGSGAITDAARSVLALAKDDETDQVILSVDKSSYSTAEGLNYAYKLESVQIETLGGRMSTVARAAYVGESTVSVADLHSRSLDPDDGDDDRNAAQAFLRDYLQSQNGWEASAGDVIKAGRAAGFNDTELKNARKRSRNPRIESVKGGFAAGWVWAIGGEGVTEGVQGVSSQNVTPSTPSHSDVTPSDLSELDPSQFQTPMLIGENT